MAKNEVLETYQRYTDYHQYHSNHLKPRHSGSIQDPIETGAKEWRAGPNCLCKSDIKSSLACQSICKADTQKHGDCEEGCHYNQDYYSGVEVAVVFVE